MTLAAQALPAHAEYKKVKPDKRSQAQIAEDQCEAQSNGSRPRQKKPQKRGSRDG